MKRPILSVLAVVFCLFAVPLMAVDVAEDELRGASRVDFVNFEGRRIRRFDPENIRDIGSFLSAEFDRGETQPRYARHYTMIHVFDESQPEKLGADIVVIERAARVNHIATIRYLLAGFLETHYGYNRADADLLALFTTYYNAVHRGDMAYFNQGFQSGVLEHLSQDNAGLARSYEQWAGASRIVIPLTEKAARREPGALDTSALGDKEVVQQLQQQDDRGVDERKDLVALQEKEIARTETEVAEKQQTVAQEKEALAQQEQRLAQEKEETRAAEEALAREKERAAAVSDEKERAQRQAEVAQKEQALTRAKEEQATREQSIEEKKQEVAGTQESVLREEARVQEKKDAVAEEKREIKRDERIVEAKEDPAKIVEELEQKDEELARMGEPIARERLYYLKVNQYITGGYYANDLYAIDTRTGEVLFKAPARPAIAGHQYYVLAEGKAPGVLVLTHSGDHREAHYLTLLDLDTLEPIKKGDTPIFHRSFIEKRGDFFYAINFKPESESFHLGKYDMDLDLVAESADAIDQNTVFHIWGDFVYVNNPKGRILVLDVLELSRASELRLD